jgi:hypothetical protein
MADLIRIERRLAALRRGLRLRFLWGGLARLSVAGALTVAALVGLDWLIHAERPVRAIFATLAAAGVALVVRRALWKPLAFPMRDDDLALAIEARFPQLGDRLISALQLSRSASRTRVFNSPALVARALDQALEACEAVPFAQAVRLPAQARWTAFALGVGLLFAALVWGSPDFRVGLARLVTDRPWPSAYALDVQAPPSQVAQGDDLPVIATLREGSRIPRRVVVHVQLRHGEPLEITLPPEGGGYRGRVERLTEDLTLWVTAGDFRSPDYPVRVLEKPGVSAFQVHLTPPEYTGLPAVPMPPNTGHLRTLRGSRVHVEGTSNKPLSACTLSFSKRSVPLPLQAPTRFSGDFMVEEADSYVFTLEDTEGLKATHPVSYQVTVIQDQAPLVRILKPGKDLNVLSNARIPLEVKAQDDYGLGAGTLGAVLNRGTAEEQQVRLPLCGAPSVKDLKVLQASLVWDLAPFKLEPGRQLRYLAEVADLDTVSGPNLGRSQEYGITIVSREDFEAELQRRIEEMVSDLQRSREMARQLRNDTEVLAVSAPAAARESKAMALGLEQGRLGESLQQVRNALGALQEAVAMSGAEDPRRDPMLQGASETLQGLVEERLPSISETLKAGGRGDEAAWSRALADQQEVVQEIEKVSQGLSGAASFGDLLKRLERLIEDNDRLIRRTGGGQGGGGR